MSAGSGGPEVRRHVCGGCGSDRASRPSRARRAPRTRGAVVVVSALSGITDRLLHLAAAAAAADEPAMRPVVAELQQRHDTVARQAAPESASAASSAIAADVAELRNLLHAIGTLKDASPRTRDAVAAFGELLSSRIDRSGLSGRRPAGRVGRSAARADHQRHVRLRAAADGRNGRGRRRASSTARRRGRRCRSSAATSARPRPGRPRPWGGEGRTIRRPSSARRSTPSEIQIWTDVDGMMTADPRVVPSTARGAAAVVRGSLGAGVLRRQGPASEHDSAGRRQEHPGQDPEQPPVRRRRHAHHLELAAANRRRAARRARLQAAHHGRRHHLDAHADGARLPPPRLRSVRAVPHAIDVVSTSEVSISVTIDDASRLETAGGGAVGVRRGAGRARHGDSLRGRRRAAPRSAARDADSRLAGALPAAHGVAGGVAAERDRRAAGLGGGGGDESPARARSSRATRCDGPTGVGHGVAS